jgi:hypothetical protein
MENSNKISNTIFFTKNYKKITKKIFTKIWLVIFRSQFEGFRPAGLGVKGIRTNSSKKGLVKLLHRF